MLKRKHKDDPPRRQPLDLATLAQARELFWQNVMREMLTSLSMQRARLIARLDAERRQLVREGQDPGPITELEGFDGRMAIVTRQGERIPIADITPLFACSIGGTMRERALSEDVQCTIFQVRTPSGEVYTFPIPEIRGFHALTEEAMRSLQREAAEGAGGEVLGAPFGFAAFTSLARELGANDEAGGDEPPEDQSQAPSPPEPHDRPRGR